ncbi:MAG: GtrA family protein [Gammaproteobacteria bacterium]|jgi:putative flippase GtrA|nr:GtrA family protein [Gammaproteobacteria bacterium]MDP6731256.1 GtrA family protein [Gammaproteobacteria bacterium]|tara:strand:- start:1877 stop:2287 length:411 start_codon:yes stop_codon:yes gene_type:complete
MTTLHLALKYTGFAVLATVANLLAQETSIRLYADGYAIMVAMLAGTLAGWVSKYLLDKHYIFEFETSSPQQDFKKFLSYGLTGLLTTAVFWSFELSFELIFGTKSARYLGAVIGLSIGYGVKYHFDKHFVFQTQDQ